MGIICTDSTTASTTNIPEPSFFPLIGMVLKQHNTCIRPVRPPPKNDKEFQTQYFYMPALCNVTLKSSTEPDIKIL